MKNIAVIGELLWDCIGTNKTAAGAPFNFAKQCIQCGKNPIFVTAVGNDDSGLELEAAVANSKMRAIVQKSLLPTGFARVYSDHGQNRFELGNPAAWDEIGLDHATMTLLSVCDAFYFGTLAQRHETSRNTIHTLADFFASQMRFCDLNLRPPFDAEDVILWSLSHCDVLKMSDGERHVLSDLFQCSYEDVIDICFARFDIQTIVETLGEKGARGYMKKGDFVDIPAPRVEVRSTVGAGDAFFAAFVSKSMDSEPLESCIQFAVEHAARVIAGQV